MRVCGPIHTTLDLVGMGADATMVILYECALFKVFFDRAFFSQTPDPILNTFFHDGHDGTIELLQCVLRQESYTIRNNTKPQHHNNEPLQHNNKGSQGTVGLDAWCFAGMCQH